MSSDSLSLSLILPILLISSCFRCILTTTIPDFGVFILFVLKIIQMSIFPQEFASYAGTDLFKELKNVMTTIRISMMDA